VICKSFLEFNKNPHPQPPLPIRERGLKIVFEGVLPSAKHPQCKAL